MSKGSPYRNDDRHWIWRYLGLAAAGWTLALLGVSAWYLWRQPAHREELARTYARAAHQRDVLYRRFVAMVGGVYAPTGEVVQPNRYLDVSDRDIRTPSGKQLTLVNPAYMTRLVHELAANEDDILAHITSSKPINSANAADDWELEALAAFERGQREVSEVVEIDGQPYMRLMRPLYVEQPCMACHAAQGYEVGDVRGGISVTLPAATFWNHASAEARQVLLGYAMIYVCGLLVIIGGGWMLVKRVTQRDRLLKSLRQSERRFRRLFEESNDAIFICDLQGQIVDVNGRACEMLQYEPDVLVGRSVAELHAEGTRPAAETMHARILAAEDVRFDSALARSDGSVVEVEISARVVNDQGKLMQGIVRDVTERNQAMRALKSSQEELSLKNRLADVFLTSADEEIHPAVLEIVREHFSSRFGYFGYVDDEGRFAIPAMTREVWQRCDLPEKNIVFPPDQWGGIWGQSLREKRSIVQNGSLQVPQGHVPLQNVMVAPIVNQHRLIGQICVANAEAEYTEDQLELLQRLADYMAPLLESQLRSQAHARDKQRSEAALRDQLQFLETLLDTIPSAIFYKDTEGRYLGCNETFCRWMRVTREQVIGKTVHEVYEPALAEKYAEMDSSLLRAGGRQIYEFVLHKPNGAPRNVLFHKATYRDASGEVAGLVGIATDITERKETEAALAVAKQQAEAANRAKSDFLANMSHEIRTPMTAILGFAEMLLRGGLDDDAARSHLKTIHRNGEILLELINDILDLSKIEAGKMELEFARASPFALVEGVRTLMDVRAAEKNLDFRVDYRFPLPAVVNTDATRLRQILVNLLGNAVKFTERGRVRLQVVCDRGKNGATQLRFVVKDSGIGMSDDAVGRLFQPFTQADNSTTRRYGGTGLGLAISQRLANLLGGRIDVQSEAGVGSTFTVHMELAPGDAAEFVDSLPQADDRPGGDDPVEGPRKEEDETRSECFSGRVLLAEDGLDNQRLIGLLLAKAGLDVDVAEDGEKACRLAAESQEQGKPYDLILMDMQMPRVDGYEATQRLRREGWTGPVIALTAHAMSGDRERCLDVGCTDYLSKPVQRDVLLDMVARHLQPDEVPHTQ